MSQLSELAVLNAILFPFDTYYQKILTASGLPFISNHAFNFWAIVSQWKDIPDTKIFFGITYRNWSYLIASFFMLLILKKLWKGRLDAYKMFFAAGLGAFAAFLLHDPFFSQP